MRRSDRTSGPPRRPLDDEFEGTAPPEGRGRRARDDDRGGNDEGRRSRRVVERTRVRFSQEDLDAELRERRAAAKNKEEKERAKRTRERRRREKEEEAARVARAAEEERILRDNRENAARARQELRARQLRE